MKIVFAIFHKCLLYEKDVSSLHKNYICTGFMMTLPLCTMAFSSYSSSFVSYPDVKVETSIQEFWFSSGLILHALFEGFDL